MAGVYQTRTSELVDKMGDQNTLGLKAPTGGTLTIWHAARRQPDPLRVQDFIARFSSPAIRGGAFAFHVRSRYPTL